MISKLVTGLVISLCAASAFAGGPNSSTITVKAGLTYDGGGKTFNTVCNGQSESQAPLFELQNGATVKNLHIGKNGADGIHCEGTCTITNVVWDDVCEDAATLLPGGKSMTVNGGSASNASDKVFQHNAANGTITVNNFTANTIGKLVRSCGDCSNNGHNKHIVVNGATLTKVATAVVGVNSNYGDTAKLRSIKIKGYKSGSPKVCDTYNGSTVHDGSTHIGEKWNTAACDVSKSDVTSF